MTKPLTIGDKLLIGLLVCGSLSAFLLPRRGPGEWVLIEADGQPLGRFPLKGEENISAQGPLGLHHIRISGGKVWVVDSPCPHKLCVKMGKKGRAGEVIVCVPNRVIVRVEGKRDFDSITP